jgi:glycine/D-amino acid oxidase-like deaminating enzyme
MADSADIVVIGGGCIGASIAWQLARRGAGRVVLLEKQGIASGATGWSSAIVRMHYTHEELVRMALFGREMFGRFDDEVGGDCGFRRVGFLVLLAGDELAPARRVVEMQRRLGIDARMLTPEEVLEIEPRLAVDDLVAGTWEPDSGHADGSSTALAFADAARREGADLRIGAEATAIRGSDAGVTGVETTRGPISAGTVVVAAGFRTPALLKPFGVKLPMTPVRHSIAVVERTPDFGAMHPVISDRPQLGYYRPEGERQVLLGAHDPLEGAVDDQVEVDKPPPPKETNRLMERFVRRFPAQADAAYRRGYTGTYDCTPDFQPVLGAVEGVPGLHVAAGFSGHGFKLSPAVGHLLAEQVIDGAASLIDIGMFRVERFAEGKLIESAGGYSVRSLS